MAENAQYTAEQVASVEAKLKDFYDQLPEEEKPVVEAILDQAFAEVSGYAQTALLNSGWTFFPSYAGGFATGGRAYPGDPYLPSDPFHPTDPIRPQ
jgi:hypothetical protein